MNKLFNQISTESSLPVEHHIERLALEADFISNAVANIKNIIPRISEKFEELRVSFNDDVSPHEMLIRKSDTRVDALEMGIKYASYASLDKTLVTVPEGFRGSFNNYAQTLLNCGSEIFELGTKSMSQVQTDLAMFISNRDVKISSKDKLGPYKTFKKDRENIERMLGAYFSDRNVRSKAYLTEVIGSLEAIRPLNRMVKDLDKISHGGVLKKIARQSDDLNNLLKVVIEDANNNENTEISAAAARNISEGVYEAAKCVELIGIYRFRVDQLIGCHFALVEQMEKIVKK